MTTTKGRPGDGRDVLSLDPSVRRSPVYFSTDNGYGPTRQKTVTKWKGATYERDVAVLGNLRIPETIDIPLAAGEVKLLSLRTQPLVAESFNDFTKVTTELAVEWVENGPETK